MSPTSFDPAPFSARRQTLLKQLGDGVALIPTAPERVRNRDSLYPYRFDSYFWYLTGFPEPEAALVLVGGETPRALLFCREKNVEREIWDGFRYGPAAARDAFGVDEAYPIDELEQRLREQQDAERIIQKKLIPETEVTVRVANGRPPFSKNANTDALASTAKTIYQDLGRTLEPVAMRFGTDAGYAFNPANPRQAVLEGMGIVGDKLHSSDEWADLDSIVPRLYLTVKLLENQLSAK